MTKVKKEKFVTKELLDSAVDTILNGINNVFEGSRREVNERLGKIEASLKNVENGQRELKTELSYVKDEISGLKADLSDTPSRKEFENLKRRVDDHFPLS